MLDEGVLKNTLKLLENKEVVKEEEN